MFPPSFYNASETVQLRLKKMVHKQINSKGDNYSQFNVGDA